MREIRPFHTRRKEKREIAMYLQEKQNKRPNCFKVKEEAQYYKYLHVLLTRKNFRLMQSCSCVDFSELITMKPKQAISSDTHLSITKLKKNRMPVPIRPRTTKVPQKILFEHKSDKIMAKKKIRHFTDGYVTRSYRHGNQIRLTYAEMQPLLLNTKLNELQISQKRTEKSSISQHKKEIEDDYKKEAATRKGFFKRMCRRFQKLFCWNKN